MSTHFDNLVQLMARLRGPDGCPWDRKQTHASLKPYLLEEAYEVLETIDRGQTAKLREELGDLLLQILFHAQIGAESGAFTIDEVMAVLAEKLIRRHPHVFGDGPDASVANADEVLTRWEDIKRREREQAGQPESALNGVPKALPALLRAYQVQARASRVGFDWPHTSRGIQQVIAKVEEEVKELQDAVTRLHEQAQPAGVPPDDPRRHMEAEFGDLLFALVNLGRFITVNPEDALRQAVDRFTDRFHHIESEAARAGRTLEDMSPAEMDALWEQAKREESRKA